ncbi:MAG: hypothetical protein JNJ60_00920 [Rhodocyclaceae bacterium]|nr:hypothetical protein [Rhodocyclaceae bacterium]
MPTATETEQVLATPMGGRSVGEHIAAALARGQLIARGDAGWTIADTGRSGSFVYGAKPMPVSCQLLMHGLFKAAYGQQRVPYNCRNCYKVRLAPRTFRELMAVHELARPYTELPWKCGSTLHAPYSSGVYAAFFYLQGLDAARNFYHALRARMAAHPQIAPDLPMRIKRGCTLYEVACGPSDRYPVAPEAVESWLLPRLQHAARAPVPLPVVMHRWLEAAHKVGDTTYLEHTGGRPLHPAGLSYDPGPAA